MGILCTCIPACKPFFLKYIWEPVQSRTTRTSEQGSDEVTFEPKEGLESIIGFASMPSKAQLRREKLADEELLREDDKPL